MCAPSAISAIARTMRKPISIAKCLRKMRSVEVTGLLTKIPLRCTGARRSLKKVGLYGDGALGGIRTHDPSLRRAVLYPAELRARGADFRTEPRAMGRNPVAAAGCGWLFWPVCYPFRGIEPRIRSIVQGESSLLCRMP